MRLNTKDETLKRNYIQKYQFLINEYEQVKAKKHPSFKLVKEFYAHHGTCAQTFLKYYGRHKQSGEVTSLLPQKRGARFKSRRTPEEIEELILKEREKGCNKYEIHQILGKILGEKVPCPSTIYNILRRRGKNRKTVQMKEEKRRIVKEKAGELAHIDCYHLSKDTIANTNKRYYIVGIVDSCTRIAWAEITEDIQALTVMFGTLHCFNHINNRFGIQFVEALTDNGPEFGPKTSENKANHPFERLLIEMGVKHRYIKPYRPQTNGKVERFWRTLHEDLIEGTYFESIDQLKQDLYEFLLYYNKLRPHQALDGKTPEKYAETCQRIV